MASLRSSLPASNMQRSTGTLRAGQAQRASVVMRASAPELKRPELKRPDASAQPAQKKLFADGPAPEPTIASPSKVVTVEYQRQRAKEMNKYFQQVKFEEQIRDSRVFGWTPANEINNGRWVMFGFAVGLLTEYATGVNFIDQLKLTVSYLGIFDLE